MMRLSELEPQFIRVIDDRTDRYVDALAEAQGIMFLCPKCFTTNGGPVGTHMVICWFKDRAVPDDRRPLPGRWGVSGTGYDDLTLDGSIRIRGGCEWHEHVKDGEIVP